MSTKQKQTYVGYTGDPQDDNAVFLFVKQHLLKQKARALDEDNIYSCQYRTPSGLRCAAGCLIPDSSYRKSWEGTTVTAVSWFKRKKFNLELLMELQRIHDGRNPVLWSKELKNLQKQCNFKGK